MAKERDGIKEIEKVCKAVLKLEEEDFNAMDHVIKQQLEFISPMKMATTGWQHELGKHNNAVLEALKNLRSVIENGKTIQRP